MPKIKNIFPSKKKQQIKNKIGKPPGTLIYVGEGKIEKSSKRYLIPPMIK
jgi:hypothetical protein